MLNPLYQVQRYCPVSDLGAYIFTISSASMEDAETMLDCIIAIEFM